MQLSKAISEVRQVVGAGVEEAVIARALRDHAYSVPAAINEIVDISSSSSTSKGGGSFRPVSNDDDEIQVLSPVPVSKTPSATKKRQRVEVIELLDDDDDDGKSSRNVSRESYGGHQLKVVGSSSHRYREPPSSTMKQARTESLVNLSTWPKVLGRRSIDAESTYRGRPPPEMVPGASLIVRRTASSSTKNYIIRLATTKGSEVARLPSELSQFLAPCMDAGFITCRATVDFLPETLNIFTRFGVTLEFAVASPTSFDCFEKRAQDAENEADKKKKPASTGTATVGGNGAVRSDQDVSDDLWRVMQVAFGTLTVDGVYRGRLAEGAFSLLDDDPTRVTTLDVEREEKKLSDEELFGTKDTEDSLHPPDVGDLVESSGLSVDLRPHQRVAVNWMKKREEGLLASTTTANTKHHPLWTQAKFEDGTSFFINRFTRMATMNPPPDVSRLCKGGILADEMGLGKTIVVLGRITQDLNEYLGVPGPSVESSSSSSLSGSMAITTDEGSEDNDPQREKEMTEALPEVSSSSSKKKRRSSSPASSTSSSNGQVKDDEDDGDDFEAMEGGSESAKKRSAKTSDKECGTLVIVVTSLLTQWEEEIASKVSPKQRGRVYDGFTSYVYYGADRDCASKLRNADVVLTTFGVVAAEHKSQNPALFNINWRRIVLE